MLGVRQERRVQQMVRMDAAISWIVGRLRPEMLERRDCMMWLPSTIN